MKEPAISVCVPVYNAARFIRECVESVLAQTFCDFELILIDDGSTDETCDIIESYTDPRIRLVRNKHDYINTQNSQLYEGNGKYIALFDHDDRMLPDRLMTQYNYMEEHPEIDVLGGGAWVFGQNKGTFIPGITNRPITLQDMLHGNQIFNPTVMIRRSIIEKYKFVHESQFIYADDYGLWVRMLEKEVHIENIGNILIEYRTFPQQISSIYTKRQQQSAKRVVEKIKDILHIEIKEKATDLTKKQIPVTGNKITLIIPFLNEKDEVKNTVASARSFAGYSVDIITINDHSDDGYDYITDLQPYQVTYIYNETRLGVAASRDLGVKLCTTPYFLLLDSHMRFYDNKWPNRIISLLEANDRRILCCQTKVLHKENGRVCAEKDFTHSFGAYLPFIKGNYLPDIKWNLKENFPNDLVEPIGAILGAGYAGSKRYWNHLRGLEGLLYYGGDEVYLSIKTWLEGGSCILVKDITIGHLYRQQSPFHHYSEAEVFNYLWIATLLFPKSWSSLAKATALYRNKKTYEAACRMLAERKELWIDLKLYYRRHFKNPFWQVLRVNQNTNKEFIEQMQEKEQTIGQVASFLSSHIPESFGLVDGKAGNAIWFFHYARFYNDRTQIAFAQSLWNSVQKNIDSCKDVSFHSGLAGIGWAAIYLFEQGFIGVQPTELLRTIDQKLFQTDIDIPKDKAFSKGWGGIIAYAVERMQYAFKQDEVFAFEPSVKDKLICSAKQLLDISDNLTSSWYAMRFLDFIKDGGEKNDFPPALHNWMSFRNQMPQNCEYWDTQLNGCAAASTLHILFTLEQTKTTEL